MGGPSRDPEKLRLRRKRARLSERGQAREQRQAEARRSGMDFVNVIRILAGCGEPIAPGHPKRNRSAL